MQGELFRNQLWQVLGLISKAGFLAVATPLMLHVWGAEEYGLFALCSSMLASMYVLDAGLRDATRLSLCEALAQKDETALARNLFSGCLCFSLIGFFAISLTVLGATQGWWHTLFHVPAGRGEWLLVLTVTLMVFYLLSYLLLEPMAASNQLSQLKAANTLGAVLTIPTVCGLVWAGGSVQWAVALYFASLLGPNVMLFARSEWPRRLRWSVLRQLGWLDLFSTYRKVGGLYAINGLWVFKSHALTFLVSALSGPAEAGRFYIFLRVSELISSMGTATSETLVASLRGEVDLAARRRSFAQTYRYALIFSVYAALGVALTGAWGARLILGSNFLISMGDSWAIAALGLGNFFAFLILFSAMGLGLITPVAMGTAAMAFATVPLCYLGQSGAGSQGTLIGTALGCGLMVPMARRIARELQQTFFETWGQPWLDYAPAWFMIIAMSLVGTWLHPWLGAGTALTLLAVFLYRDWRRLHRD